MRHFRYFVAALAAGMISLTTMGHADVIFTGGTFERDTTAISNDANNSTSNTSPPNTVNYSNSDTESATSSDGTTTGTGTVSNSNQVSVFSATTQLQLNLSASGQIANLRPGGSAGGTASASAYSFTLTTPMEVFVDMGVGSITQNATGRANSATSAGSFVLRTSGGTTLLNSATDGSTLVFDQTLSAGTYLFDASASALVTSPVTIGTPNLPAIATGTVNGFINFTAVPEPASLSLLGIGGMLLMRRRRC